ncbi:hypothetical protein SAMCCGM7_pC1677 (plasmid) [Sinorhizobium americanum CCGM7]|nr:hypothetical protein SAMCCGM7_pC1677 [Sinorhizobium americanum CCGM7]
METANPWAGGGTRPRSGFGTSRCLVATPGLTAFREEANVQV